MAQKCRAMIHDAASRGTELALSEVAPQHLSPRMGFKDASSRKSGAGLLKLQLQKPVLFVYKKPAPET